MTHRLQSGPYEELLTSARETEINARTVEGWWVHVTAGDASSQKDIDERWVRMCFELGQPGGGDHS